MPVFTILTSINNRQHKVLLAKHGSLLTGAVLLTVMTWFTIGKVLPLGEASAGPASRASGSETRDTFKNKAAKMHIFILKAV